MAGTFPTIATAIMAGAAGVATAGGPGLEYLRQPLLPGFGIGYEHARGGNAIEERVLTGETVTRWTRMVTAQRFAGANARMTPEELLHKMGSGVVQGCQGGQSSAIETFTVSGRPAAEFRADCPLNPATGRPEVFFARAISGTQAMHVVKVTFRRAPTKQDIAWAESHLNGTSLCHSDDLIRACT